MIASNRPTLSFYSYFYSYRIHSSRITCYCLSFVVNISWPPSRSQHVSRDRVLWKIDNYSIKTDSYLHMRVDYTPRIKQVIMNRCRFSCMRFPPILVVTKILQIQNLRLQSSMIFALTTSPTKNINILSFPTRREEKKKCNP